jgi:hypothetical protein
MPPVYHTILSIADAIFVAVEMVERARSQTNSQMYGFLMESEEETPPTNEEILAEARRLNYFDEIPTEFIEYGFNHTEALGENGPYRHSVFVNLYDMTDYQDRNVEFKIPRGDLPTPFTNDDVIAWGVANGLLNPS